LDLYKGKQHLKTNPKLFKAFKGKKARACVICMGRSFLDFALSHEWFLNTKEILVTISSCYVKVQDVTLHGAI